MSDHQDTVLRHRRWVLVGFLVAAGLVVGVVCVAYVGMPDRRTPVMRIIDDTRLGTELLGLDKNEVGTRLGPPDYELNEGGEWHYVDPREPRRMMELKQILMIRYSADGRVKSVQVSD